MLTTLHARTRRSLQQLRRALAHEGGWASDAILLVGILLLVVFGLQLGLWFLGNSVAHSAALSGYNSARAYQSTEQAGSDSTDQILGNFGTLLGKPNVAVQRTPTQVTVTVKGTPFGLIPGLPMPPISATETGPVERWVPTP